MFRRVFGGLARSAPPTASRMRIYPQQQVRHAPDSVPALPEARPEPNYMIGLQFFCAFWGTFFLLCEISERTKEFRSAAETCLSDLKPDGAMHQLLRDTRRKVGVFIFSHLVEKNEDDGSCRKNSS